MLKKLFKYDLIFVQKALVIYYFLMIVFALVARLTSFADGKLFEIVSAIFTGASISMMFSAVITCVLRSWSRFRLNFYKDESYLTHSLPVTKTQLFTSKILSGIACNITCFISIIASIFIGFYTNERFEALKSTLFNVEQSLQINLYAALTGLVILLFLELLVVFLLGDFCIVIGQRANDKKILKSVITGIVLYFITQSLNLVIIAVIGLFDNSLKDILTAETIPFDTLYKIIWISIIAYLVYALTLFLLGNTFFKKGVNVE